MGWVRSIAVGVLSAVGVAAAASGGASAQPAYTLADRAAPGFWKTEKAKFLDKPEVLVALVQASRASGAESSSQPPKETAQQIGEILWAELADERGVKIETLLTAIGALAGFSTQMVIREEFIAAGRISEKDAFVTVETKSGATYYTGKFVDEGLMAPQGNNLSVWSLVAAAPNSLGKPVPDLVPIVRRVGGTYGKPAFGVPDLPARNMPQQMPEELLWKYWNVVRNLQMTSQQSIQMMPFVLGQLAQETIIQHKDIIDPTLAARIVMEAAIPMSRISPDRVAYARFKAPD